ncbi:MAG: hypothetical protein ACFB4J_13460 [Elainellaceae cyanobacterium]
MARKFINKKAIAISAGLILLSGLMAGCGSDEPDPTASNPPETGEPQSPPPESPSEPSSEATPTDPSESTTGAPQGTTDPAAQPNTEGTTADSVQGKNVLCSTPSQTAQVTWEGTEPRFTLTEKPNQPVLNQASPVAIREDGGSITYGYLQETTAYLKTFDSGNCMVQTLDAQGNVVVEEYGRTS